jgi:hypothetical protein
MAAENIGSIYTTKIPGYEDNADIQAALRLYHYGSTEEPDTIEEASETSLVFHLKGIQDDLDELFETGIGSKYGTEPVDPDPGFIWMDSSEFGTGFTGYPTVLYSPTEPTEDLVFGLIWVDSDSPLKRIYVYDGEDWVVVNEFESIVENAGDLLVGNTVGELENLTIPSGSNGYVLTVDSSEDLKIAWKENSAPNIIEAERISIIMGVY